MYALDPGTDTNACIPSKTVSKRILSISRNGYYANEKPFSASGPLSDSGSIYYADAVNKKDPVFYFKGKDLELS